MKPDLSQIHKGAKSLRRQHPDLTYPEALSWAFQCWQRFEQWQIEQIAVRQAEAFEACRARNEIARALARVRARRAPNRAWLDHVRAARLVNPGESVMEKGGRFPFEYCEREEKEQAA